MYTLDYLNCFIENLDLPEASRASLRENCEMLVTTPGAIDELVSAETLLFKDYGIDGAYGAEWKPIVPHMDALSERTGLHRHVVDFLFLALASERLRENYRAAGLTDELFWDTIADLKFKLIECHDVYGIWGTFVASWYPWFYTMHRFKLGRLQYEAVHFSGDTPVTVGGYTVKPGDTVYNMHIPSCGSLNRAVRIESYKKAYEFYKKDLDGKPMVFHCHSWLLFPKNREILPETLNMVDFIGDFYIYDSEEYDVFHDKWRVFAKDFEKPNSELPEDTTQRRCFKKWLLDGKKTGAGAGIFIYNGEEFTK